MSLFFARVFMVLASCLVILLGGSLAVVFNIYIHDLPETLSKQYGYADDLAIMLLQPTRSVVEEGLNQYMSILADYLHKWRLQLSMEKTVAATYQLCKKEAKRELSVYVITTVGNTK